MDWGRQCEISVRMGCNKIAVYNAFAKYQADDSYSERKMDVPEKPSLVMIVS